MKMLIVYGYIAFQGTTQNSDLAKEITVFDNPTGTASTTVTVQDITGYKYADIYLRCAPSASVEPNLHVVTIPIQIGTSFNIEMLSKTSVIYMHMYKAGFANATSFVVDGFYRVKIADGTIFETSNQVAIKKIVVHN